MPWQLGKGFGVLSPSARPRHYEKTVIGECHTVDWCGDCANTEEQGEDGGELHDERRLVSNLYQLRARKSLKSVIVEGSREWEWIIRRWERKVGLL